MKSIRSSWNSDRVAACVENRPRKVSAQKKVVKMYTEIRARVRGQGRVRAPW